MSLGLPVMDSTTSGIQIANTRIASQLSALVFYNTAIKIGTNTETAVINTSTIAVLIAAAGRRASAIIELHPIIDFDDSAFNN